MLLSNQIDRLNQSVVIVMLVLVAYAQNVLTRNDQIAANTINQSNRNASVKTVPFVEYYIEHNVSSGDAKRSFFEVGIKLVDDKHPKPSWCLECTDHIKTYCLSGKMLDDHCCCDSRHKKEQIPWIPHSCYVETKRCTPSIGSCINYTEIRECCCDQELAKQWKEIFSSSTMTTAHVFTQLICVLLLVASQSFN